MAALLVTSSGVVHAGDDPLAAEDAYRQKLFERIAPSVVFISNGQGFGSGFIVDKEGVILTNAHVVGKAQTVAIVLHDGRRAEGTVTERGADNTDLALVKIPLKNLPTLALGNSDDLRVGAWAGSVGHGRGAIWTFNTGIISNIYPSGHERPVFQTQIPLNPGSSGGPIFNRRGVVVGVVTAGITDSNSINFGIQIDVAYRTLNGLSKLCDCLVVEAPKGVPIFIDGKMAGKGPRVAVKVEKGVHEVFAVINGKMQKQKLAFPAMRHVVLK